MYGMVAPVDWFRPFWVSVLVTVFFSAFWNLSFSSFLLSLFGCCPCYWWHSLVRVKDITPKDKRSHVVYGISCAEPDCQETYVGETKQALKSRVQQHQRPSSRETYDSAVYTPYTHLVTLSTRRKWSSWTVSRTGSAAGSGRRCTNELSDRHWRRGEAYDFIYQARGTGRWGDLRDVCQLTITNSRV